jgi:predicted lipoprotein
MTIWVNQEKDSCGIIQACIATKNKQAAQDCHANWQKKLTETQRQQGWQVTLFTVESWDDVPVNALKIN